MNMRVYSNCLLALGPGCSSLGDSYSQGRAVNQEWEGQRLLYTASTTYSDYYIQRLLYKATTIYSNFYIQRLLYTPTNIYSDLFLRKLEL